jgi:hypothetical protein
MFSNVISIHLRRFKSVEDFEKLLSDNELDNIDPEACFNLMMEGYTKIFIDKNTFKIVGYCHGLDKKLIQISEDFVLHLKNMNSISFKKSTQHFTIDSILDKINEKGIDSLTKLEKEFLNNNSSNK